MAKTKSVNFNRLLFWLPPAALFLIIYFPTLRWLYERYTAADTYYSHGFLVPFVTAFLIWLKKEELKKIAWKPEPFGLAIIVASLLVHFASVLAEVFFLSGFSIVGLVFGMSLFLFGKIFTKKIAFPLFFLAFMFPLPLVAVNAISFPMKFFVTKVVVFFLKFVFNLPIRNEGFQIFFPNASLVVENPCSGLRSLIVMLALGSIFTYFLEAGRIKKALFFALSIPVALISNITRVTLLSLSVYVYGGMVTEKYIHDFSGYLMFLIAFGGLWLLWRAFNAKNPG